MNVQFDVLKKSREIVVNMIDGLTIDQLHLVPEGFNNNIAWNVAHLVVTQQLLHYELSGLPCLIPDELIDSHRKGTRPSECFSQKEFQEVKELLIGLPDTLREDYRAGIFNSYEEYETSTGYVLRSLDHAIAFNNLHEGIHLGIVMAMKKLV
ncbi:MAG TPA: damage-inducible protein DinB [Tenacibaculum sp.]|nr:damage-inducible protein DinB [Tenacibaculum sp.]